MPEDQSANHDMICEVKWCTMWKKPAQKSIRETSVEIWFTNFPFVNFERARDVSFRDLV